MENGATDLKNESFMKENKPRFALRAMTSVFITAAFLMLTISGAVLFLAPPGRIANWSGWSMLGLTKYEWICLHVCFAALFVLAAFVHLWFNLRPLIGYFKSHLTRRIGFRWEWAAALALALAVFAGTLAGVPPFSTFLVFQESLKRSWEDPQQNAPIPHAELLTLRELAEKAGVPLETALRRLESAQVRGAGGEVVVSELAGKNRTTGQQIYTIISQPEPGGKGTKGQGMGFGQMTLKQFCDSRQIDLHEAQTRLEKKGIRAAPNLTLRDIAAQNNLASPREVMDIIEGNAK